MTGNNNFSLKYFMFYVLSKKSSKKIAACHAPDFFYFKPCSRFDVAAGITESNFKTLFYDTASCCQGQRPLSHSLCMMLTGWYQYLIKGSHGVRHGSFRIPPTAADCSEGERMEALRLKISGWYEGCYTPGGLASSCIYCITNKLRWSQLHWFTEPDTR